MLGPLGLSHAAEALYERLLAEYSIPLVDGHGMDETAVALLIETGLAVRMPEDWAGNIHAEEPRLVAVMPDDAITRLLLAEELRINKEREELLKVRRELAAVRELFEATRDEANHGDLVQILAGRDEVIAAYKTVLRTAERDILLLDIAYFDAPPQPAQVTAVPVDRTRSGEIRYRTIYDHSIYTEYPDYMQYMLAESRAAGEVQRIVPRLPLKMIMADESLALVALTRSGIDGAMLVRSKRLVAMLRSLFESLWEEAAPLSGSTGQKSADHPFGTIPALLGAGLGDDAVARQLALGLRTVRRRIAELSDELGAASRFQAGVLAERRGFVRAKRV